MAESPSASLSEGAKIREDARDSVGEIIEEDIARIQWVRARKIWKIYWKRADLKWHRYDPHPEAANLAEALRIIDEDACCCFFG